MKSNHSGDEKSKIAPLVNLLSISGSLSRKILLGYECFPEWQKVDH